jgi:hypothetical protein
MVVRDTTAVGPLGGLGVIVLSVALAGLLNRYVERFADRRATTVKRAATVLVCSLLAAAVPLAAWQGIERATAGTAATTGNPGAAVLFSSNAEVALADAPLIPRGSALEDEWVTLDGHCTEDYRPIDDDLAYTCFERRASVPGAGLALIIGDSHAQQWMATLLPATSEAGWDVVALIKGGCGLGSAQRAAEMEGCADWQQEASSYALQARADLIVLMGSRAETDGPGEIVPEDLGTAVQAFVDGGSKVMLIRDNPRFGRDIFECVESLGQDAPECRRDRSESLAARNPAAALAAENVYILDFTELLCPDDRCLPVIGNVVVYLDDNHITGTYAASMAPAMRDALVELPGLPLP